MSAIAKPASTAPDQSSTTAAAGGKARYASRVRIRSTPAWPTAVSRSAFISARIAAPACSGKATRTRRPAASRSGVSPTPISRPRTRRLGGGDAFLARTAARDRALPAIALLRWPFDERQPVRNRPRQEHGQLRAAVADRVSAALGCGLSELHFGHPRRTPLHLAAEPGTLSAARLGA